MTYLAKKSQTKKSQSKMKNYRAVFIVFLIIAIFTSVFSFRYYKNLSETIREESKTYLREVSQRIGKNLDLIIENNFSMLYTLGVTLEELTHEKNIDFKTILKKQKAYWNYEMILLVDKNGKAYDIREDRTTFLTFNDTMRTNMLNKKEGMAATQIVDNKEYLIFSVPLNQVRSNGDDFIALAACYDPSSLDQVLSMTSFDDQAYSQIVTKSGTVVTRSSSAHAIKSGYNIFSTLQNAVLDDGDSLENAMEDIQNNLGDQISFSLDGVHRYMIYTPIQPNDWYLLTFVPFQAVNEKSDTLLNSTLMICGFIVVAFCILVAILLFIFNSNRKKLEQIAYVDQITHGNTIQKFYDLASEILASSHHEQYALLYTNIENFKVLNAQLGRKNCDSILKHFHVYASSTLHEKECIGRLAADNFCILMHYTGEAALLERLKNWGRGAERYIQDQKVSWGMPSTEFGVYVIENNTLPFTEMIDRAKLALKEASHSLMDNNKLRYAFYDDNARRQLFREKQLSDMMESALANGEFQVYLQPKYHLPEEEIKGAEALVRWKSASEGMIYPNEFIPLFEKNGFIVQLDLWVFEEVCRTIRKWIDHGLKPIKVSINCSRVHFRNSNFLSSYIRISSLYDLDRSFLEIELTESVVFENTEHLTKIIQEIKSAGFGCSMDDFGSGYSSLNLLQTIPVDTLKIDKIFFQGNVVNMERTEALVGSIVQMAQSLFMITVAEGVEHREQVDMLKRIGCDYIQGYVFAKPMEVASFEKLAFYTE